MTSRVAVTSTTGTTTSNRASAGDRAEWAAASLDIWPQLTRFYGIPPSELARMPRVVIIKYIEQMGPISSSEQLDALEASVYPHVKQADARRISRRRVREARKLGRGRRRQTAAPAKKEGTAEDLARLMGGLIPVEIVAAPGSQAVSEEADA